MISLKELTNKQIKNITIRFDNIKDFEIIKSLSPENGETDVTILLDKDEKIHKFNLKNKRKVNIQLLNTLDLAEKVVLE